MADSEIIWINGELIPYDEAKVHVLTHSLHYGSAAFEGVRAYSTKDGKTAIFRAKEHMDRLFLSMKAMGYVSEFTSENLVEAAQDLIRRNNFAECYIRPLAFIDDSFRGLKLPKEPKAQIAIAVWKWGKYLGDEGQQQGIRVMISSFRRGDISSTMPWAKLSGNYVTSIMARREASLANMDEAVLLDQSGYVAEGSGENLFAIYKDTILTPPAGSILPGITRDCVMQIAKKLGYTAREEFITRNQLYLADEVFFTGTAAEVTPIREVDHHTIGQGKAGPITKKISDAFFKSTRGEIPEFKHWLTYV